MGQTSEELWCKLALPCASLALKLVQLLLKANSG